MPFTKQVFIAFVGLTLTSVTSVVAGTVSITPGSSPDSIVVEAKDATMKQIMDALGVRFKFQVEGAAAEGSVIGAGRWGGTVDAVIARILKQHGHVVVRSETAAAKISRVILLGPMQGPNTAQAQEAAVATSTTPPPPSAPESVGHSPSEGPSVPRASPATVTAKVAEFAQADASAGLAALPFFPAGPGSFADRPVDTNAMTRPPATTDQLVQHFGPEMAYLTGKAVEGFGGMRGVLDSACKQSRTFCN